MIKAVPIPLKSGKTGWIHAGPTREAPKGYTLVRCALEIEVPGYLPYYDVMTADFSPFPDMKLQAELPGILSALEAGDRLYVGCMGGTGRTGTLLALLVAQHPAFTGETAIAYIRQVYKPGAVETSGQERQVKLFELNSSSPTSEVPDYEFIGDDYRTPLPRGRFTGLWSGLKKLWG